MNEKTLSFNSVKDIESASAGEEEATENVLVRRGRCSGSFIHAPDSEEARQRSQEDRQHEDRRRRSDGITCPCLARRLTTSMGWLEDGPGLYLYA